MLKRLLAWCNSYDMFPSECDLLPDGWAGYPLWPSTLNLTPPKTTTSNRELILLHNFWDFSVKENMERNLFLQNKLVSDTVLLLHLLGASVRGFAKINKYLLTLNTRACSAFSNCGGPRGAVTNASVVCQIWWYVTDFAEWLEVLFHFCLPSPFLLTFTNITVFKV